MPDKQEISISLFVPENYIGKEVEVIAFSKREVMEEQYVDNAKKATFDALSIDTLDFKFNRDEANER